MNKCFCDICKKPLEDEPNSRYKLKREWYNFRDFGWDKLDVHDECWRLLCREIRKLREAGAMEK